MKGIQDENYIPDSHMSIVVGHGGLLAGAPHAKVPTLVEPRVPGRGQNNQYVNTRQAT